MSKGYVECVHWDPNVDQPAKQRSRNGRWLLLALGGLVIIVGVSMSVWLFGPSKPADNPADPTEPTGNNVVIGGDSTLPVSQTDDPWWTTAAPDSTAQPATLADNPYLTQGIGCYDSGNYDQALALLTQAISLDPASGSAYSYRGLTYFQMANYQAAFTDLSQAMRYSGITVELVTLRGQACFHLGWHDEAISDLTEAIKLSPNNTNAYTYRALAYDATGRHDLAEADRAHIPG